MAKNGGTRKRHSPEIQQACVDLRKMKMQVFEIAAKLKISPGSVHMAIKRLAPELINSRGYLNKPRTAGSKPQREKKQKRWTGNDALPVRPHVDKLPGSEISLPTPAQLRGRR